MKILTALLVALSVAACTVPGGGPRLADYRVLHDDLVARVVPGQTRDEVAALLGPPESSMFFPRLGHTAWDYRYTDTWGYHAIFSVTFDARGVVVSRVTQRIERERPER